MTDIVNNLPEEHIRICNFIWYHGFTSMHRWDCPAQIVWINTETREFKIQSLDDLVTQEQKYSFDVTDSSPDSRKNMTVPTLDRVKSYVNGMLDCKSQEVLRAEEKLAEKRSALQPYQAYALDLARRIG